MLSPKATRNTEEGAPSLQTFTVALRCRPELTGDALAGLGSETAIEVTGGQRPGESA